MGTTSYSPQDVRIHPKKVTTSYSPQDVRSSQHVGRNSYQYPRSQRGSFNGSYSPRTQGRSRPANTYPTRNSIGNTTPQRWSSKGNNMSQNRSGRKSSFGHFGNHFKTRKLSKGSTGKIDIGNVFPVSGAKRTLCIGEGTWRRRCLT